jgi:cytochrome c oxidase assembly protein subunit 15
MQEKRELPRKMVWLSFVSLSLTYSIMLIGVFITSSHQGLSCPGWPLCPNGFDFPSSKYFFEHFHRMLVLITSGFIIATALYSVKKARSVRKTAVIAALIVLVDSYGNDCSKFRATRRPRCWTSGTGMVLFAMLLLTLFTLIRKERTINLNYNFYSYNISALTILNVICNKNNLNLSKNMKPD